MDAVRELTVRCPRCGQPGEPHCTRSVCDWLSCEPCSRAASVDPSVPSWRVVWSPDSGTIAVLPVL